MTLDGDMKKAVVIIIVSVALLFLFSACSKKSDLAVRYEMEKKLNEADRLQEQFSLKGPVLLESDFNTLVKAYSKVIKMVSLPDSPDDVAAASKERKESWAVALLTHTRIGALYRKHKEYDKAYNYYKTVFESPAANSVQACAMINYMALCREKAGKFMEAAELYDSLADCYIKIAVPINPNMDAMEAPIIAAEMWLKMGDRNKYNQKLNQARNYYNKFREKFPDTPLDYTAIGKMIATYLRQADYQQAIALLRSAKNDSTGLLSPRLMLMIADIQMKYTKQYKELEKTYREFIRVYPEHDRIGAAYLGLGISLYEQGRYSKARKAMQNIEEAPKVPSFTVAEAYYLTALCYEKEDRWEKAIGQFDLIMAAFPGHEKAFEAGLHVANRYKDTGQTKIAQQKFIETMEYIKRYTNPETANRVMISRAMGYLVRCYTEMKDIPMAIETLIQTFNRYPNLPEGKYAPLRIADLYENVLKDNQKAAYWLKTFIRVNPDKQGNEELKAHIDNLEQP